MLDSVVPTDGPEPFAGARPSRRSRRCSQSCAASGACAGISANPLADLARLATRLHRHALSGSVYDGAGQPPRCRDLDEIGLLGILQAGDLNPALRALLPAAVHSALHGDPDPLLRLDLLSEGLIPNVPSVARGRTRAGGRRSPVRRPRPARRRRSRGSARAPASTRLAEAKAALHAQPAGSDFYPFDAATAFDTSLIPECAPLARRLCGPAAAQRPAAERADADPLGRAGPADADLRRARGRRADPRRAAADVVPFTGHSVIGSDLSGCADHALTRLLHGRAGAAVRAGRQPLRPDARDADAARARPPRRGPPRARREDARGGARHARRPQPPGDRRDAPGQPGTPRGASFGGLRGGYARLSSSAVTLHALLVRPGRRARRHVPGAQRRTAGGDASGSSGRRRAPARCGSARRSSACSGTLDGQALLAQSSPRAGSRAPARAVAGARRAHARCSSAAKAPAQLGAARLPRLR